MNKLKKTRFTGVYTFESPTKRHHGRPDIAYYITFKVNGKKIWEPVGWASKEMTAVEASKRRSARMAEIESSGIVEKKKLAPITLDEAWNEYLKNHLRLTKSERRVTSMYNSGVKPTFGRMYLSEITPKALDIFKAEMSAKYAPATVKHFLTIIQVVFRKMSDWGYWNGPIPTDKVRVAKKDNRRIRFLTQQEADYLLDLLCLKSADTWALAMMSLHTGMRFGEIAVLRGEHVDLVQKTIKIVDSKGVLTRTVPMTRGIRSLLLQRRPKIGELVFPGRNGMVRRDVPDTFARVVEESGLNAGITDARYRVVFHSLRHTYASWLVQAGVPLYTVGELLGHSSIEMTKRYAHLSPDSGRGAVDALEKAMRGS